MTITVVNNQINVQIASMGQQGVGMPAGGTTGQIATKLSDANYDIGWEDNDIGSVTSVSINTDNGFYGSVENPTTDARITLNTSVIGVIKGDGSGMSAATTTDLPEGDNLYFTTERAQDAVGAMVDGTLVYVDATPLLTRAALSGDITAPQSSNITTLATVNSNTGSFGTALLIPVVTLDGKGRVTAASTIAIAGLTTTNFASANISQWTNDSGYLTSASITGLVPYTGATNDVNLGAHSITAGNFSGSSSGTNTGDQTNITGNAGTATALQNARTIGGVSFDGTANITVVSATSGFTISGGDLSVGVNNIACTGSIGSTGSRVLKGWFTDLQVTNSITGSITGNAATATALQNARAIGGVSFDGTANIVPQTIESNNEAADTTCFPLFITASGTQQLQPKNNTALTFNSSTGAFNATSFGGAGTGLTGTAASLTAGTVTTNANLTGAVTSVGNATSQILGGTFFYVAPTNITIPLISSARYAFTINGLNNLLTSSGTITAAIQINGVNVTGLSALSVSSIPQSPSASAANSVAIGDRVTLVLSANSSSANMEFTMKGTR